MSAHLASGIEWRNMFCLVKQNSEPVPRPKASGDELLSRRRFSSPIIIKNHNILGLFVFCRGNVIHETLLFIFMGMFHE